MLPIYLPLRTSYSAGISIFHKPRFDLESQAFALLRLWVEDIRIVCLPFLMIESDQSFRGPRSTTHHLEVLGMPRRGRGPLPAIDR